MFEKEAEEYASNVFNPVQKEFFITRGLVQGHIAVAFEDGAEFGYNKAKEEMQAQIEKMKNCHNCRKFHNLSYDCTCAEVCNEWEIKEND